MVTPASPAAGYAAMQTPDYTAQHSYLVHPAALQAALVPSVIENGAMLASLKGALLPGATNAVASVEAAVSPTDCAWASLYSTNALSIQLQDIKFLPAQKLGLKPAATSINAAELLYGISWQASTPALATLPFPTKQQALLHRQAGHYRGDEALAGAEVARLLAHHRDVLPNNELSLLSNSAVSALPLPSRTADHVAAAFVSGVLKNLPYELPAVHLQAVDQDALAPSSGSSYPIAPGSFALTARHQTSPEWAGADMYGASSVGRTLLAPLLTYSTSSNSTTSGASNVSTAFGNPQGAGIITGGLGGLGSMAASWAMGLGTGALVLLGRSGCLAGGAWTGAGALMHSAGLVIMAKADASFVEDATAAIHIAAGTNLPLTSVMHAAGVQTEARLLKQTPQSMRQAAAPKLAAFRKCSGAAPGAPIAANMLFSSVSSITGNANHANYAGANAALDALAEQHASQGGSVVAAQWGAWASVGKYPLYS